MLNRSGNKKKLMSLIYPLFPRHKMRIDLFFGAGGAFFDLPKPKYAILNDLDDDVTNLYLVIQNHKDDFVNELKKLPASSSLVTYWKTHYESDPIKKALRFLFLSNFTYLGKGDTLRLGLSNTKEVAIKAADSIFHQVQNVRISNYDFREVIPKIQFPKKVCDKSEAFVFMDPVYLDTSNHYKVPKWHKNDTLDCLDIMKNCGIKSMMCEFSNKQVVDAAKSRNLEVRTLKQRHSIKSAREEIIITNYSITNQLFNVNQ